MKPTFVDDNVCLETEVQNLWVLIGRENNWPIRSRLTFNIKCALLRLHKEFITNLGSLYPKSSPPKLMDLIEKIARERWNWKRSPAPMTILGAESSWLVLERYYLEKFRRVNVDTFNRISHLTAWSDNLAKRNYTPEQIIQTAKLQQRDKDISPEDFELWKQSLTNQK